MQSIKEIYSTSIKPLPTSERVKLVGMIMRGLHSPKTKNERGQMGGIRDMFGTWRGRSPVSDVNGDLDHNERIDRDLGLAYADDHEDRT
jgi:hypothetical protein